MVDKRKTRHVALPMIAHYNPAVRYFVEQGLGQHYIRQPKMTRKTLRLGAKYAPDMVCTPFKTILGSMMEALEAGADTLIMSFGYCRLGYYGELAEVILRDLGYEFDYLNLAHYATGKKKDLIRGVKKLNPKAKMVTMASAALGAVHMVEAIDEIEAVYYENCGFEVPDSDGEKKQYETAFRRFLKTIETVKTGGEIASAKAACLNTFANIPINKGALPLRVGLIGEYFTAMDDFSNDDLEKALADMGVEVHRWMNLTNRNIHYPGEKNLHARIKDYCQYEMGPTSTANIWFAKDCAERGFDGIIHVKSAGCTPEIAIMPVLSRIARDYHIPILYLTYDAQDADAGLKTRLEAFYDMIEMRKQVRR